MQKDSRFFDDLARLATGAVGGAMEMKREFEAMFASQQEKWLRKANLVTRDEFEAVKTLAAAAKDEVERLNARVAELEAKGSAPRNA